MNIPTIREFRLSPPGTRRGISCDANGVFVGSIALLRRSRVDGRDVWRPRDCSGLSKQLGSSYGLPIDMSSKMGGLNAISRALNEGDIARAQVATVLLGIPEPPTLAKNRPSRNELIKFIRDLHWSELIKWDPDEHPRWPTGAPDSQGGQFAPKGEDGELCNRTTSNRRRWMRAKNKDWPMDNKTGRPQDVAHIRARADGGSDEADNLTPLPHDEHVREHMERNDFSRWAPRRGTQGAPVPQSAPEPAPKATPTPAPKMAPEPATPPAEEPVVPDELLPGELPIIIPE